MILVRLPRTTTFGYDHAGNRTSEVVGNQTTNYSYNALDQLTQSQISVSGVETERLNYRYDGQGSLGSHHRDQPTSATKLH